MASAKSGASGKRAGSSTLPARCVFNQLKYVFVVEPGADAGKIRIEYSGISEAAVGDSVVLAVSTPAGVFEDGAPFVIVQGTNLKLDIDLSPGAQGGQNADWWLLVDSPLGWYRYRVNPRR